MKIRTYICASVVSIIAFIPVANAQSGKTDFGKREYNANCANCHGLDGKGSGPYSDLLKKSPPNLTTLAKNNGGILPIDRLYQSIVGDNLKAHGSRDMPIWGMDYRVEAANYYMDSKYDPDAYVRVRVLALIEYINRLQVK